jgi:excisionase family DNA binding protein
MTAPLATPPETLGIEEAAELLRVSKSCLLRKVRAAKVPGAKFGKRWVFIRADLLDLIRQQSLERALRVRPVGMNLGRSAVSAGEARLDARIRQLRRAAAGSKG